MTKIQPIKKAVFPVAGLGTRFLPATKATPKEMLPIVDKPLIEYAVEEAIAAGITELIFITSQNKRSIEDHFDVNVELENRLLEQNKTALLKTLRDICPDHIAHIYVRQTQPLGLGHAVLCAQPVVNEEPFAVLLADDLIDGSTKPCLSQMMEAYQQTGKSIVAVEAVDNDKVNQYGIVAVNENIDNPGSCAELTAIIEKPRLSQAPSNFGVTGRYLLSGDIFNQLKTTAAGAGGEIQLTDAIAKLITTEGVCAYHFDGRRYDCGSKLGYLQATVDHALKRPDLNQAFKQYLKKILSSLY